MKTNEELKSMVREKYTEVVEGKCCGTSCCDGISDVMSEEYSGTKGYEKDADLNLGCGLPVRFAKINKGDTVVDLGSGAGNDAFVARAETGDRGKVIGIDMTKAMIDKARTNAEKLNYNNVEFRFGDIEDLPLNSDSVDVVVSNCVLNLVPDKLKAFSEMYRVIKPGGHFSISDIVTSGELPLRVQEISELYAGCVSGAIQKSEYLNLLKLCGFENIVVQKERPINIPDEVFQSHLSGMDFLNYKNAETGIFSITVYGEKKIACCDKEICCN